MREILSDLVAEEQSLDQLLQRIPPRDWGRMTPAKPWTIQSTVSHLAASEEFAHMALTGGSLPDLPDDGSMDVLNEEGVRRGKNMRPQDVIEWWRGARAKVVEDLSRSSATDRVPWFVEPMSARTFATCRLAETWAHGLDLYAAAGAECEDTPRLRHVAWLSWKTLPYAYSKAGNDYREPVRLEVMGPAYAKWVFGSPETDQFIKAAAGEWCRIAVRRLDPSDAETVKVQGAAAETALQVVRTYI